MALLINLNAFRNFFRSKSIGGIILILCVIISLLIANSAWGPEMERLLATPIGVEHRFVSLRYSVLHWINDGLMAVFFLLIGLEIKRELVEGELSAPRKAALPIVAAFGGAIVPAILFFVFTAGTPAVTGWGIPMATDIAFALCVISLLGNRVPASLKVFLAALAIVDDLIAILVIAIFYSGSIQLSHIFYSAALFLLLIVFNRLNFRSLWYYLIPGLFIWYFIHHSGIHATIAGVITAMAIPTNRGRNESPLERLERYLTRPVNFLIMPLFALANTNINLEHASLEMLTGGLGMGIITGLWVGKPVGILLASWLMVRFNWGLLPAGAHWGHMLGLGILAGIGFTMSIFISLLSFSDPELQVVSKFSILVASTAAGIAGYCLLAAMGKRPLPAGEAITASSR